MAKSVRTFTMVGSRGVGKTSLLTAMYDELSNFIAGQFPNSTLTPDNESLSDINARRDELIKTTQTFSTLSGIGISPSQQEKTYVFELKIGKNELDFHFADLPGGWYTAGSSQDIGIAIARIAASPVTLLPIDAVALMESPPTIGCQGKYHLTQNNVRAIQNIYSKAFSKVESGDRSIIMVLVRAEKYVRDKKEKEMYEMLRGCYEPFVQQLRNESQGKFNLNVFACHVETVGTLFFNAYIPNKEGIEVAKYICPTGNYEPRGCSIPLKIAFSEVMSLEKECINRTAEEQARTLGEIEEKKKELQEVCGELEERARKIAKDKDSYNNVMRWIEQLLWGDKSTLSEKAKKLSIAIEDYEEKAREADNIREEIQRLQHQIEQTGEMSQDISKVIDHLKNTLKSDEYIKL